MERIGRYQILGELGRGAMGVVYRALDTTIGRAIAIKTIRLTELADGKERSSLRDRLFREAQAAGILSHPNIVTVYDVAEEGDLAYIAMEYVDGPTLERMLGPEAPDRKFVLDVLSQTAAALDYAHKRGIVHRDIKPANIMLHERQAVKITDFGVAKIQSHQMTHGGALLGTPNYMSPEQVQGQAIDGRADQFSLAVIAYELLTGEKPFLAESMPALVFKIVREEPAPVHRLNPTLEWPVDTVIKRALAKDVDARYPSCSDFVFALENACRSSKNWKPMPPGGANDLPTVHDRTAPVVPAAAAGIAAAEPRDRPQAVMVETPPAEYVPPLDGLREAPKLLRIARVAAAVIVVVGLLSALLIAGLQYFSGDEERQAPAAEDATAGARGQRPSAMGGVAALPGEGSGRTPQGATPADPTVPDVEDMTEKEAETPPAPAAAPAAPPKPATAGSNSPRFVSYPPGATITVDNASTCTAPCTLDLGPGRHTLAATMDGYRRTLRIFELPRDNEIFLTLQRTTGTVVVRSEPKGASIIVDGEARPEKTPAMLSLATGDHKIEVVLEGNREVQQVNVKDSVITNVAVDWSER